MLEFIMKSGNAKQNNKKQFNAHQIYKSLQIWYNQVVARNELSHTDSGSVNYHSPVESNLVRSSVIVRLAAITKKPID